MCTQRGGASFTNKPTFFSNNISSLIGRRHVAKIKKNKEIIATQCLAYAFFPEKQTHTFSYFTQSLCHFTQNHNIKNSKSMPYFLQQEGRHYETQKRRRRNKSTMEVTEFIRRNGVFGGEVDLMLPLILSQCKHLVP